MTKDQKTIVLLAGTMKGAIPVLQAATKSVLAIRKKYPGELRHTSAALQTVTTIFEDALKKEKL